jgi:hypothetical protein
MCGVRVRKAAQAPRKNTAPAQNTVGVAMPKLAQRNSAWYWASMPLNAPP